MDDASCYESSCDDASDNDGDGLIDCQDSDCDGQQVCVEQNCSDLVDNEGDGLVDCDDSDCSEDPYCFDYCIFNDLGSAIGSNLLSGNNTGLLDELQPSTDCSSGVGGEDVVFSWTAPATGSYTFSTVGSDYDTVLYITDGCSGEEIECNDNDATGTGSAELTAVAFTTGTEVTIVIDSADGSNGNYVLNITSASEVVCDDGADDDGDGDIDCSDSDCSMNFACASISCPNFDMGTMVGEAVVTGNSSMGTNDYSGTCTSAGGPDYSYAWEAPGTGCAVFDTSESTYDTVLLLFDECNGVELACNDDSFGTQSEISYEVEAGVEYLVVVDGWSSSSMGDYTLDVAFTAGVSCSGGEFACDDGLDNDGDGDVDCADPDCAILQACNESDCTDGVDNEGDGFVDCDDPDCATDSYCYESDCTDGIDNEFNGTGDGFTDCDDSDCVTDPSCYESSCVDGIDNDGDGLIDCADSECETDNACIELNCNDGVDDDGDGLTDCYDSDCVDFFSCEDFCVNTDLADSTGIAVAVGTNIGLGDNFSSTCSAGTGGEEEIFSWYAPASGTYTFSTENSDYDTILYMYDSCVGAELECNDDEDFVNGVTTSKLEDVFVAQGESVVIVIDGYDSSSSGNYSLDIISTFEPDCTDGLDNDGDGDIDCADSDCDFDGACSSSACPNFDLGDVTGDGLVTGTLDPQSQFQDQFFASCASQNSNDLTFAWEATVSGCATVDTLSGTMDSILVAFDACPGAGGVELACNDDYDLFGGIYESEISFDVVAGSQYIIGLDSWSYSTASTYVLDINVDPGVSCP